MFAVGVSLLVLFALAGAFVFAMQSSFGRQKMISILERALQSSGWKVEIAQSEGALPDQFFLHDITIESTRGDRITIQSLKAQISLLHLLKKEICFSKFEADRIQLTPGEKNIPIAAPSAKSGLSFILSFPNLQLTHVALPGQPSAADISGQIKIGRYNRMAFVKLTAKENDAAAACTLYIRPSKQTQFKLDLTSSIKDLYPDTPLQLKGDLHLYARGPWEAFSDLIFGGGTQKTLRGFVHASVQVDDLNGPMLAKQLSAGRWSLLSVIERTPAGDIRFSHLTAKGDVLSLAGLLTIAKDGSIKESALSFSIDQINKAGLPLDGSLSGDIQIKSPSVATFTLDFPRLTWKNWTFEKISAELHAQKENDDWGSDLDLKAMAFGKPLDASCHMLWLKDREIRIDDLNLRSDLGSIVGNLAALPHSLFTGELRLQIVNLHDFEMPLYGSIDTTLRLTSDGAAQSAEIDAKGSNLFYGDARADLAFFYADLTGSFPHLSGHAYAEIQRAEWEKLFIDTATIDSSSIGEIWPIHFRIEGDWKGPFDLLADAMCRYDSPRFQFDLEDLKGSLFGHPLALSTPSRLIIEPDIFRISDLDLSIGNAQLKGSIDHQGNESVVKMLMDRFPLDFLSINPLSLSVVGFINLDAELKETTSGISGSMQASIVDAAIMAEGDSSPLTGEGTFTAKLSKNRFNLGADIQVRNSPLLHLTADLPLTLKLWPFDARLLLHQNAEAMLTFNGEIEELLDFFDLGANRLEGKCQCDLQLSNDLSNPHLAGHCELVNGHYENYYSGLHLQNIQAEIVADGSDLLLKSLTAEDDQKKGHLSLKGSLLAHWLEKFPFHFDGDFSRLNVAEIEWMRAEAGGTIQIVGDLDSAHLKIQAAILESDLSIPERIPHELPKLQVKYINAPRPVAVETANLPKAKPYPIFLDCHVFAPDGVFISGRGLSSEWKGNFDLGGTYTDIEAKGRLEMVAGEFLFSGHALKLTEGSLTFNGKPHEMPYLNLAAQMNLPSLTILARLQGPINRPELAFQSIPALPMGSILSHLLFGQDLSEVNAVQAAQIVNSIATFSGESPSIFEKTRRSLGVDRLRIVATPIGDEGGQSIALQVGKYVTRGVLISVSQGAEGTSTNLMVEVDLANGFLFQAESQQQLEQGKFTIKWNLNY